MTTPPNVSSVAGDASPDLRAVATDGLSHALLSRLVDTFEHGVLLLGADGRVHLANRSARDALAAGGVLRVDDGRLALHGPQQQRALQQALADAALGRARMLCLGGGVPTVKLALSPWDRSPEGGALLLGTLLTGERDVWPALLAFARERRLTDGETDVLHALVHGERPPQIAARRGSTEGTVRSQIKALLEKTDTHSMRELVVEALHLPPVPAHAVPAKAARRAREPSHESRPVRAVEPLRVATLPASRDPRPMSATRGPARCARTTPPLDRRSLLALRASQFAWPPAA
jgi:DNA-binding CsgD family transcriptional regulator